MGKDPAFLFYPGDYLRDTQCLSEVVQVAYDRIMCEHMRNICITQQQLNFFTKKLTEEEKQELKMTLTEIKGGYQITWVAESINNRRAYSQSRAENRRGKHKEDILNISKTYVKHMENENESEIEDSKCKKKEEKKIEKAEVAPSVLLSADQVEQSKILFDQGYLWAIETLSNYKLSSGKKYKSDFHALKGWVHDKYKKEKLLQNGKPDSTTEQKIGRIPISEAERFMQARTGIAE